MPEKKKRNTPTTDERTITVSTFFGNDKEVTKDDFVKQWVDHAAQFMHLIDYNDPESGKQYESIKAIATEMAEKSFEDLYKRQNEEGKS